jgi:hypothetical protein
MFYNNFLEKLGNWAMGVPLQTFWVVAVSFPAEINFWLEKQQNSELDYAGWSNFSTEAYQDIIGSTYNSDSGDEYIFGCLFARTINVPGERLDTSGGPVVAGGGGLIFPSITTQRSAYTNLEISFLETNSSFVDIAIRPWCIAASYAGLVARKQGNVKGSIRAIFYAKSDLLQNGEVGSLGPTLQNKKLAKRKIFTFNDVVPVTVNNQEYSYLGDAVHSRSTQFIYSSYTVDTGDISSLLKTDATFSSSAGATDLANSRNFSNIA